MVELLQQSSRLAELEARCREFDGQRNSIQPPANARDDRGIEISEPIIGGLACTRDEQLRGREGHDLPSVDFHVACRTPKRRQTVDALRAKPEGLAAGRDDPHLRKREMDMLGHKSCGRQDVLAVVEDD